MDNLSFQQEYFEPKSPFKSNDLKGLVNFVGSAGQISNLLIQNLKAIGEFVHSAKGIKTLGATE